MTVASNRLRSRLKSAREERRHAAPAPAAKPAPRTASAAPAAKPAPKPVVATNDPKRSPVTAAERTAASARRLAAITADARVRTAAAWTMARTLLPKAPEGVQRKLAAVLMATPTNVLKASISQLTRYAYMAKAAEKFEEATGREVNELVEDPAELAKWKKEVVDELGSEPKTASKKPAPKAAAAPKKAEGEEGAPGTGVQPENYEDAGPEDPKQGEVGEVHDPEEGSPVNEVEGDPDSGAEAELAGNIKSAQEQVNHLEAELEEAQGEDLDLASIFQDQGNKKQSLANEGEIPEGMEDATDSDDLADLFAPSAAGEMEGELDFDTEAEHPDTPGSIFAGIEDDSSDDDSIFGKQAADGIVEPGELRDEFETDLAKDDRNAEDDHDDLLAEMLKDLPEEMHDPMFTDDYLEPEMEAPKVASKKQPVVAGKKPAAAPKAPAKPAPKTPVGKKSSIRSVGSPTATRTASAPGGMTNAEITAALFIHD